MVESNDNDLYVVELITKVATGDQLPGWTRSLVGPFISFDSAHVWMTEHKGEAEDLIVRPVKEVPGACSSKINVVDAAFRLREMLALQTARRILTEMASHAKIGDDSYHDAVITTAESWCGMYK